MTWLRDIRLAIQCSGVLLKEPAGIVDTDRPETIDRHVFDVQ
jgi:hypothetical protein